MAGKRAGNGAGGPGSIRYTPVSGPVHYACRERIRPSVVRTSFARRASRRPCRHGRGDARRARVRRAPRGALRGAPADRGLRPRDRRAADGRARRAGGHRGPDDRLGWLEPEDRRDRDRGPRPYRRSRAAAAGAPARGGDGFLVVASAPRPAPEAARDRRPQARDFPRPRRTSPHRGPRDRPPVDRRRHAAHRLDPAPAPDHRPQRADPLDRRAPPRAAARARPRRRSGSSTRSARAGIASG